MYNKRQPSCYHVHTLTLSATGVSTCKTCLLARTQIASTNKHITSTCNSSLPRSHTSASRVSANSWAALLQRNFPCPFKGRHCLHVGGKVTVALASLSAQHNMCGCVSDSACARPCQRMRDRCIAQLHAQLRLLCARVHVALSASSVSAH